jgi:hypothetical protein
MSSIVSILVATLVVVLVGAYVALIVQQFAVCFRDLKAHKTKKQRRRNATYAS